MDPNSLHCGLLSCHSHLSFPPNSRSAGGKLYQHGDRGLSVPEKHGGGTICLFILLYLKTFKIYDLGVWSLMFIDV